MNDYTRIIKLLHQCPYKHELGAKIDETMPRGRVLHARAGKLSQVHRDLQLNELATGDLTESLTFQLVSYCFVQQMRNHYK
jgi:hypothetical protein